MSKESKSQMTEGQKAAYTKLFQEWKNRHPDQKMTPLEIIDELKNQASSTPIDLSPEQAREYWNTISEWRNGGKEPTAEDLKSIANQVKKWGK